MKTKNILLGIVISTMNFTAIAQVPGYASLSGLQGWWPLNGNANDQSVNGNNGTLNGSPTTNPGHPGGQGTAYTFNGINQYITTSFLGISGSNARAVSFWAKTTVLSPYMTAVCWGDVNQGDRFGCTFNIGSVSNVCTDLAYAYITYNTTTPTNNGNWHHYVWQSSGSAQNLIEIYQDAVLVSTTPNLGSSSNSSQPINTLLSAAGPVTFGRVNNWPSAYANFNGDLDDIGIWNRKLTQCEIYNLYNCNTTCTAPGGSTVTSSGCCLGNLCNSTANALTGNYQIPTASFDFNFTDDNTSFGDKLQVGVPCQTKLPGKFNVSTAKPSDQNNPTSSTSIYAINTNITGINTGVYGTADNFGLSGVTSQGQRGLWGYANSEVGKSIGVFGQALHSGNSIAGGAANSYGGYFEAITQNGGDNYGVYAEAANGPTNWAGWFQGDVTISGNGWVNGTLPIASDKRFKTNINELTSVTEKLKNLKSYTYQFRTDEFKNRNFPTTEQIGFIAQELKLIFPQLVLENTDGYYGVNYIGFIPVLLQAVKEQQQQLDDQKQLIDALSQKSSATTGINSINPVETGFQMSQNEPNPFTHETVIKYTLPQTISNAFMAVYDLTGKQITTFPINEKGSSSITITSEKLAAGIYIYSIVADGKVVDSKRMIVAEK